MTMHGIQREEMQARLANPSVRSTSTIEALERIVGHLSAVEMQRAPSDDAIQMGHVQDALAEAKALYAHLVALRKTS